MVSLPATIFNKRVLMLKIKACSCASNIVHMFIILLFVVAAGNMYGCSGQGNISFHNNTDIPLKIIIKRLPSEEIKCLTDGENSWSAEQRKACLLPRNYKENTVEIPGRHQGGVDNKDGICWKENDLYLASYQVVFRNGADYKKGPRGAVIGIRRGIFHFEAAINHLGDQTYIKTSGCTHFHTVCTMTFDMTDKN